MKIFERADRVVKVVENPFLSSLPKASKTLKSLRG